MSKVFLDFGGHRGEGLRHFYDFYKMNNSWIIETYEPNPLCEIEKYLADLPYVKINHCAVYDRNGVVTFSQMLNASPSDIDSQGSSVECLMSENECADISSSSYRKHDSIIEVPCRDVSEIINQYDMQDFIVVKMDIEGSEFKVLRKILQDNTIDKVDEMWIEWHQRYVKNEDNEGFHDLYNSVASRVILHRER